MDYYTEASKFVEFSKGDIDVFIQVFKEFDKDQSGSIDGNGLEAMLQSMGQGTSMEDVQIIIDELDEDGSGTIKWGGFMMLMRKLYPNKRLELENAWYQPSNKFPEFNKAEIDVFIQSFRKYDTDESGAIDANELEVALQYMGQGSSKKEVDKLIGQFGINGEIKWPQFLEMMRFFYPQKRLQFEREFYDPATEFLEFTRSDLDVFIQTFREFDLDGSGSIDIHELDLMFKAMGHGASMADLQAVIDQVDYDGSGDIKWRGFLEVMRRFYPWKREAFENQFLQPAKTFNEFSEDDVMIFAQIFRKFDLDSSGTIDPHELDLMLKSMGQGCDGARLKQIIQEVGGDSNGDLEWVHFLKVMRNLYSASSKTAPAKTPAVSPAKTSTAPAKTPAVSPAVSPAKTPAVSPAKTPAPAKAPSTSTPPPSATKTTPSGPPSSPSTSSLKDSSTKTPGKISCARCGKTVYPIEMINAVDLNWHKGCFKCQEEGCDVTLNLKSFKAVAGKIFCAKHVPKDKPTSVPISGRLDTMNATSSPRLNKAQGIQKDTRMSFAPGKIAPVNPDQK